jgi:hypothetical protein
VLQVGSRGQVPHIDHQTAATGAAGVGDGGDAAGRSRLVRTLSLLCISTPASVLIMRMLRCCPGSSEIMLNIFVLLFHCSFQLHRLIRSCLIIIFGMQNVPRTSRVGMRSALVADTCWWLCRALKAARARV